MTRLGSVGLNSLPVWLRPYAALSNGQRMRTDVARNLESGLALDDFGSTVDARNASVCAAGIARSVRLRSLERIVVASVHAEVLPWLGADWAYFPATGRLVLNPAPGIRPSVRVQHDPTMYDATFAKELPLHPTTTSSATTASSAAPSTASSAAPSSSTPSSTFGDATAGTDTGAGVVRDAVLERAEKTIIPSSSAVFFGQVKKRALQSTVALDAAVRAAASAFEYTFDGTSSFVEPSIPPIRGAWRVRPPTDTQLGDLWRGGRPRGGGRVGRR
jgi:hypothetical protein